MHPTIEYLEENNNEEELLEQLVDEVANNQLDKARMTAAIIKAKREIRFDLIKIIRENEKKTDR